jgi:hypothetical protein
MLIDGLSVIGNIFEFLLKGQALPFQAAGARPGWYVLVEDSASD